MASPVITFIGAGSGGIKVLTADALSAAWTGASLAANTDTFVEGTQSLSEKVSATTITAYTVNTTDVTGEPFSFASGGGYEGNHIFAWIQALGTTDTLANGGMGIVVADDLATDSVGTWYVGPQPGYLGGWVSYVINPSSNFDVVTAGSASWTTNGNPAQLSGVDGFGVRWKITSSIMGASDNAMVDAISVGTGYRLTNGDAGSTEGTFADFGTFEAITTNRYGALKTVSGILLPRCKLHIGAATGSTNTEFIDSNFTVIWEKAVLADGTSSAVAADFYALHVEKGTGTTDVTLSNGLLAAAAPHEVYLDFVGATSINLTNINVNRARLIDLDSAVTWNGGTISNSGTVDLGGSPTVSNIQFLSGTDTAALVVDAASELDNVSDCSFTSNNRAIKITTGGTYTLDNITFSGNTYDIEFSATAVTEDSYAQTNQDSTASLSVLTPTGVGQSFTGAGGTLSSVKLYLKKTGTPTGNAVAKIYAHSGTFGTSSIPTGSALATSDNFNVANLTTSYALTSLQFSGANNIVLTSSTKYVVTIEYSGGGVGSTLDVGFDGSSPGHGGNYSSFNAIIWSADNTRDLCFFVYTGANAVINAINGSNPSNFINTGDGSTTINNAVALTVTVIDTNNSPIQNAQVAIFKTSDDSQLMNEDTNASGVATDSFNYSVSTDIYVRVRKSSTGDTKYIPVSTTGTITASGFSVTIRLSVDTNA